MSKRLANQRLTDQRLVTYVVRKLTAQGRPAISNGVCTNMTHDGRRCAIAICFKKSSRHFSNHNMQMALVRMGASLGTVKALQVSHDLAASMAGYMGGETDFVERFLNKLRSKLRGTGLRVSSKA